MQETSPSGTRALAVGVCVLANMVDGYDVLSIAFTGSAIMREWDFTPATLGLLFSAGLAGMVIGSLTVSPFADRFGRRRIALVCFATMSVGMFGAAAASNVTALIALRVLTGLGIGGVLAPLNTLVAEHSAPESRNRAIGLLGMGYPLGATLGGVVAGLLLPDFGWRSVFMVGGAATALVFVLSLFFVPESARAEARAPSIARQLSTLFEPGLRFATPMICAAFFLALGSIYFVLNWTPNLVEAIGLPEQVGVRVGTVLNFGGIFGAIAYGVLADRLGAQRLSQIYLWAFGVLIAVFALSPAQAMLLYVVGGLTGVFIGGVLTCLYALAARTFPTQARASGTGLAIGIGRIGATLGPLVAGYAVAAGIERTLVYLLFAAPPLIVGFLIAGGPKGAPDAAEAKA